MKIISQQIMHFYAFPLYPRLIRYTVYLVFGTHLAACGWFLLACSSLEIGPYNPRICNVGSWALKSYKRAPLRKLYWVLMLRQLA